MLVREGSDASELESLGAEIVRGELVDPGARAAAAAGCDHVYHLAALIRDRARPREDYLAVNVSASEALVREAAATGATHFVYASSTGIHGFVRKPPLTESSPLRPNSYYHETKFLGERAVVRAGADTGLAVTVARLPSVIGVGKKGWEPFLRALSKPGFRCIGSGENHIHMGTVRDIVRGLRHCAERETGGARTYLLAGPAPMTINRMIEIMTEEIDAPRAIQHLPAWPYWVVCRLGEWLFRVTGRPVEFIHRYSLNLCDKVIDTSRARAELGFEPGDDVEEALRETVRWYQRSAGV